MACVSDPTLDFLAKFDDPSLWDRVLENVPIFVENERTAVSNGKRVQVKVDEARLQGLAERLARKEARTGVVLRGTEGHLKLVPGPDGKPVVAPQNQQPPILAYGRNVRFGHWGPGQEPGVLCDVYIPKGGLSRVKDFPYRSLEFYPREVTGRDEDDATGFAFLKTDPALDMGMLTYERGFAPMLFALENQMDDPTNGTPGNDPTKPPDMQEGDPLDESKKAEFMRYMQACCPQLLAMAQAPPPLAAAPAPGPAAPPPPGAPPVQMQRDVTALHYERLKGEVENKLAELNRRERVAGFKDQLQKLADLGYGIDVGKQVAYVADFTAEQFARHEAMLVEIAPRDPGKMPWVPVHAGPVGAVPADPDIITESHQKAALHYQRKHDGIEWEEAVEKTRPAAPARR